MTDIFESKDNFEDVDDIKSIEPTNEEIEEQNFDAGVSLALNEETDEELKTGFTGITEDEWKDVLAKANRYDELQERLTKTHDKAFGKIGQLEQQLRELEAFKSTQGTSSAITKDTFKNVAEYFADEEFAEKLAEDLAGIQFGGQNNNSQEFADFRQEFEGYKQEAERKILTVLHPDWKEIVVKPEFATWQTTLTDEGRAELEQLQTSKWDGLQAAKAVSSYKNWESKKSDIEAKKKERLLSAVPAKGAGVTARTSTLDAEDAFNAGLNAVRSGRKG